MITKIFVLVFFLFQITYTQNSNGYFPTKKNNLDLIEYNPLKNLKLSVIEVKNNFFGLSVTVSGLLTGQDMLRAARSKRGECDVVVLPPNCLNRDNLFLDNLSLDQFRQTLDKQVVVGSYNLTETIREVFV